MTTTATGNSLRLRDPGLRGAFHRDGYVVVDMLDAPAIAALTALWDASADPIRRMPFNVTIMSEDSGYRAAVSAAVENAVAPAIAVLFDNSRFVYGSFVVKPPSPGGLGIVPLHQDPSFIDETAGDTCNVWIPLIDVDSSNGCLRVIPGSHRLNRQPRSNVAFFRFPYPELHSEMMAATIPVPLRAGQAIVTAQTLFHGSAPNASAVTRCAVSAVVAPADAMLIHYFQPFGDLAAPLEAFAVDRDFFCRHRMNERPAGDPLATLAAEVDPVTAADVTRLALQRMPT